MQVGRRKIQRKMYIRNKKNGVIYDSIRQASTVLGISTQTVCNYANGKVSEEKREHNIELEWITLDDFGMVCK